MTKTYFQETASDDYAILPSAMIHQSVSDIAQSAFLDEVKRLVTGDRNSHYGPPEVNHARTAKLASIIMATEITPRQICMLNAIQKMSRDVHCPKHDNLVDIVGYMANAAACEAAERVNGT